MTSVRITADEGLMCLSVGSIQYLRAEQKNVAGMDHGTWVPERGTVRKLGEKLNGLMAEYALCSMLGVPWRAGVQGIGGTDAEHVMCRSTEHARGELFVPVTEALEFPDTAMAMVTGSWPIFKFAGWLPMADIPQNGKLYHRGDRHEIIKIKIEQESYWVSQAKLLPSIESLREFQLTKGE